MLMLVRVTPDKSGALIKQVTAVRNKSKGTPFAQVQFCESRKMARTAVRLTGLEIPVG